MKCFVDLEGETHEVEIIDSEELTRGGRRYSIRIKDEFFSVNHFRDRAGEVFALHVNNQPFLISAHTDTEGMELHVNGDCFRANVRSEREENIRRVIGSKTATRKGAGEIKAPMPGLIVKLEVSEGDSVRKGQGLLALEAMKMENEIKAPVDGIVKKCLVSQGEAVTKGQLMMVVE